MLPQQKLVDAQCASPPNLHILLETLAVTESINWFSDRVFSPIDGFTAVKASIW